MKRYLYISLLLLAGCQEERYRKYATAPLSAEVEPEPSMEKHYVVIIRNRTKNTYCFESLYSRSDRYPGFLVNGTTINPDVSRNYLVQIFNDVNIAGGVYIIPPGESRFPLDFSEDYPISQSENWETDLEIFDCKEWLQGVPKMMLLHLAYRYRL